MADLKRDEGSVKNAAGRHIIYIDSVGHRTIGYGHLVLDGEDFSNGLSEAEADALLISDIHRVALEPFYKIFTPPPPGLTLAKMNALLNMLFNLGEPRFRGFKKMIAAIKEGDWKKAADEALDSKWASQVGARADRIAATLRS